jgi:hypothetical protein
MSEQSVAEPGPVVGRRRAGNDPPGEARTGGSRYRRALALGFGLLLLGTGACVLGAGAKEPAAEKEPPAEKRAAAGKSLTAKATILRREKPSAKWQVVDRKETLYSGDLLIGMPDAQIMSRNGAVRLEFLSDLDHNSPYPIHEAGIKLHSNPRADLEVTLDRGRIDLVNAKKKGAARVLLHVWHSVWDLTLEEPGTAVALELFGRWPPGSTFKLKPGPKDVPTGDLILLVLKGEVDVKHGGFEHALRAPPGPAMIEWDNHSGADETPHHLKKLPEWAQPGGENTPVARKKKAVLERFRKAILAKGIDGAVQKYLHSDKEADRAVAVVVMGALDDLHDLGHALRESKHHDVWEHGVVILRHWLGRAPGQDQRLYQALVKSGKYSPVDAETTVQLLHSYGEEDLARPETYEMLIDFLEHDQLAIRGLAHWHLCRLVPEGKEIGYHPADPPKKFVAAALKWRKLIPKGKIPPRPRPNQEKKKQK